MAYYGTEAGLAAYAALVGASVPAGAVLPALVRASAYIDGRYGRRFVGIRAGGYAQALAWPRTGAVTREGFAVPDGAVPPAVENAAYEAALRELAAPGSLSPDHVAAEQVKREKVGPLETEYRDVTALGADAIRPVVTIIDEMLADLLFTPLPGVLVI
ncbi:hypothetical protein RHODGE_RHODGE_01022 [Rhodoplanes serenus]|uniref:Putative DnaT-like domain-containing protein n=1 Tax=Rhodoplanes serenus TaxID=200615 RepID=A0A3S4CFJ2_9BRAD|nr:DnaT-like ssDNA-binding protein [Rhodoplanes serenus]VCU06586.1 hypothetical protein RHODPL_RHODPL_00034 [Rhodoplanes serenus]VCU07872.1 hypothetical protein RHODGE_RHODGE_01022 [Rhodoplanes serenus]